jgi:hypothetical protein
MIVHPGFTSFYWDYCFFVLLYVVWIGFSGKKNSVVSDDVSSVVLKEYGLVCHSLWVKEELES